jgi:hypothetical protein
MRAGSAGPRLSSIGPGRAEPGCAGPDGADIFIDFDCGNVVSWGERLTGISAEITDVKRVVVVVAVKSGVNSGWGPRLRLSMPKRTLNPLLL